MIVPIDLHQNAAATAPAPTNLFAIASGKGGVGKTWFSVTLAHSLSLAGKKALLFDGDLGLANVDVQLGMTPKRDLGTFFAGQSTLAEAANHYAAGGFDILAGRSGSGSLAQVAPSRLAALRSDLNILSGQYDFVIMDMGAGIDRMVRSFTNQARTCFVVATDEPTSITDAYAFIKVSVADQPNSDIRIVVNMANSVREGERTYAILLKACKEFLKYEPELGGIIRRDPHVRESIRKQASVLTRYPNTEAAMDVKSVAALMLRGS